MRRFITLMSALGALALAHGAASAAQQDFSLANKTGYQIDEVYVSPSASDSWGSDIMGSGSLGNGEAANVTFNAPANVCKWDMRVKYNDGDVGTWIGLNLCNINKVTLFWDRANQNTRAVTE